MKYTFDFYGWDFSKKRSGQRKSAKRTVTADSREQAEAIARESLPALRTGWSVDYVYERPEPKPAITKAQWQDVLPADVYERLMQTAAQMHCKPGFEMHAANQALYLEEGAHYQIRTPLGEWGAVTMMSERTLHAGATPTAYRVADAQPLPAGTFAIEDYYFCGKPIVRLHHWTIEALPA